MLHELLLWLRCFLDEFLNTFKRRITAREFERLIPIAYSHWANNNFKNIDKRQKHFLWITAAPCSWNYCFVIHIAWNVERELNIDPPIHARNWRSGGPTTFTLVVEGIKVCIYLETLSVAPGNIVDPPLKIILE